ncbi:hypothetical protein HNP33_000783 [Comamonas odontotermitis]|uniref:Uncharacterized protein n=1 Tax=Comamonas odontotermitis TaxID=379895 RepID=A0ABR6RC70_9BURK|nr:hypothetical protein [Comamonas odontotermitis]MBB6576735.1 hypothetical protein [Comamonas odontotermitis]
MTDTPITSSVSHGTTSTEWLLYAGYAVLLALACLGPHVPQAAHYHDFADQRALGGLRNALDVLSNLPFAMVGALGLWRAVLQAPAAVRASGALPWLALVFGGLLLTAAGSSYYHLMPDDWRVFWDRLGMVPVFAGVLGLALQSVLSLRVAVVTAVLVLVLGPVGCKPANCCPGRCCRGRAWCCCWRWRCGSTSLQPVWRRLLGVWCGHGELSWPGMHWPRCWSWAIPLSGASATIGWVAMR